MLSYILLAALAEATFPGRSGTYFKKKNSRFTGSYIYPSVIVSEPVNGQDAVQILVERDPVPTDFSYYTGGKRITLFPSTLVRFTYINDPDSSAPTITTPDRTVHRVNIRFNEDDIANAWGTQTPLFQPNQLLATYLPGSAEILVHINTNDTNELKTKLPYVDATSDASANADLPVQDDGEDEEYED
jgi:hypothetical protein